MSAVEVEPTEKTRYLTSPPTERLTVVCSFSVIDLSGGNPGTSCVCASTSASRIEAITAVNSAPSRSVVGEAGLVLKSADAAQPRQDATSTAVIERITEIIAPPSTPETERSIGRGGVRSV